MQRLVGRLCYSSLWIGAVLILTRLAVEHQKDKEDNSADKRNQRDKQPPSTTIRVMKPAY